MPAYFSVLFAASAVIASCPFARADNYLLVPSQDALHCIVEHYSNEVGKEPAQTNEWRNLARSLCDRPNASWKEVFAELNGKLGDADNSARVVVAIFAAQYYLDQNDIRNAKEAVGTASDSCDADDDRSTPVLGFLASRCMIGEGSNFSDIKRLTLISARECVANLGLAHPRTVWMTIEAARFDGDLRPQDGTPLLGAIKDELERNGLQPEELLPAAWVELALAEDAFEADDYTASIDFAKTANELFGRVGGNLEERLLCAAIWSLSLARTGDLDKAVDAFRPPPSSRLPVWSQALCECVEAELQMRRGEMMDARLRARAADTLLVSVFGADHWLRIAPLELIGQMESKESGHLECQAAAEEAIRLSKNAPPYRGGLPAELAAYSALNLGDTVSAEEAYAKAEQIYSRWWRPDHPRVFRVQEQVRMAGIGEKEGL